MSYATPVDAIKYLSANRLAEITGYTAGVNVSTDADLILINWFRDAILGNDLSDYSDEQQADVVVAIEVLEKALSSASSLIDSYLMRSYSLPLITYPEWITEACVSLANCSLHDDNTVEPIREKCANYITLVAFRLFIHSAEL